MTRIFGFAIALMAAAVSSPGGRGRHQGHLRRCRARPDRGNHRGLFAPDREQIRLQGRHHRPAADHHRLWGAGRPDHRLDNADGGAREVGKMLPGSRADLGRIGIGVAIREGAPAPDLSTPEAFKQALVDARSVAYSDPREGGASSIYFVGVLDRFGIAEAVASKAVLTKGGRAAVEKVAKRRGRDRRHLDQRDRRGQRRSFGGGGPGGAAALLGLCRRDPGEQHRSGRRARLHRRADRAGDGGALEGGRLRAAEIGESTTNTVCSPFYRMGAGALVAQRW